MWLCGDYLDRELYDSVYLIPPVSVVGEPLQVDDQDLWETPEVELLSGLLVFLTLRAVPGVILS